MLQSKIGWPDPGDFCGKDACNVCGECLSRCEFLNLPIKEAKLEIIRLVKGKETEYVLQKCRSCGSCNAFCPRGCDVWTLIITRQYESYKKEGISVKRTFALPNQPKSIWTSMYEGLPDDEKENIRLWSNLPKSDEVVYSGCAALLFSYLLKTKLFDNVDIMGSEEFCDGGMYYQIGLLNVFEFFAKRVEEIFKCLKNIKRLITFCPSCDHMFRHILPQYLGVNFDFEVQSITEWLWGRIEKGKIEIKSKLNKTVAIQDACHAKVGNQPDVARKILEAIGVEVIEMERSKEDALCCGMGDVSIRFDPMRMLVSGIGQWSKAKKTKADIFLTYCPGCLLILAGMKKFYPTRMPLYHIVELVQLATGEEPLHRHDKMATRAVKALILKGIPQLFSPKKLSPEEVMNRLTCS